MKMRGVISQGLILPFSMFKQTIKKKLFTMSEGDDVTELLNVTKYDTTINELQQQQKK